MIELKPIAVNGSISNKHKTISPNQHYAAYVSGGRKIHIINLKDKDTLDISQKDFSYSWFNLKIFKSIKIYQIAFNNNSDKLYCLVEKDADTILYQFNLYLNTNQLPDKQWYKYKKTSLPYDAKSFTVNETTQDINFVGYQKKQISYKILKQDTQELININVESVHSDITKIKLDPINMQLSALSANKELNIFTENNNGWKVKHTVYNCTDIPVSSQDGNILVFKEFDTLIIKSVLEPYNGKEVYRKKYKYPIIDFSINSTSNKIKIFCQKYKDISDIKYYTLCNNGDPTSWTLDKDKNPFKVSIANDEGMNYIYKINSMFTDENKVIVLLRTPYYFPRCQGRDIKIITKQERAFTRQNSSNRRLQNFSSSNSSTSCRSNSSYGSSNFGVTSFALVAAAMSSNSGYSCGSSSGGYDCGGGGFDGGC